MKEPVWIELEVRARVYHFGNLNTRYYTYSHGSTASVILKLFLISKLLDDAQYCVLRLCTGEGNPSTTSRV